ncbi:MAG: hypothetical protein ACOYMQ_10690 [Pseudanabaena sp.]
MATSRNLGEREPCKIAEYFLSYFPVARVSHIQNEQGITSHELSINIPLECCPHLKKMFEITTEILNNLRK